MPQKIVAGNWKMFGSRAECEALLQSILAKQADAGSVQLVVFPPYLYIPQAQQMLADSTVAWGGQNVSQASEGAFTGEISANMLRDFGCSSVLVGHSERRQLYGETSDEVALKFQAATAAGLSPILCVGETLAQREAGDTVSVVTAQINALLQLENGVNSLYNGAIAYEPVWAIGTGKTASPEQAQAVHSAIRALIAEHDTTLAQQLTILYGGSVKRDNAQALFTMPDIDGGLIGGASLDAEHFLEIAKLCNNC